MSAWLFPATRSQVAVPRSLGAGWGPAGDLPSASWALGPPWRGGASPGVASKAGVRSPGQSVGRRPPCECCLGREGSVGSSLQLEATLDQRTSPPWGQLAPLVSSPGPSLSWHSQPEGCLEAGLLGWGGRPAAPCQGSLPLPTCLCSPWHPTCVTPAMLPLSPSECFTCFCRWSSCGVHAAHIKWPPWARGQARTGPGLAGCRGSS